MSTVSPIASGYVDGRSRRQAGRGSALAARTPVCAAALALAVLAVPGFGRRNSVGTQPAELLDDLRPGKVDRPGGRILEELVLGEGCLAGLGPARQVGLALAGPWIGDE